MLTKAEEPGPECAPLLFVAGGRQAGEARQELGGGMVHFLGVQAAERQKRPGWTGVGRWRGQGNLDSEEPLEMILSNTLDRWQREAKRYLGYQVSSWQRQVWDSALSNPRLCKWPQGQPSRVGCMDGHCRAVPGGVAAWVDNPSVQAALRVQPWT